MEVPLADTTLVNFVHEALRAGASRDETAAALNQAGWSEDEIRDALRLYAEVSFPVPVPRPRPQLSARDAFVYLVTFATLYLSAYHFGSLLFQFVNLAFPADATGTAGYALQRIRWATAALVIAFPIFLYASYRISREIAEDPARRGSAVRRWLIYLTLTLASFIVVGDLISLVYGLLSGELTVRFVLKSLIVGVIAGAIFGFYLWTVRTDDAALGR